MLGEIIIRLHDALVSHTSGEESIVKAYHRFSPSFNTLDEQLNEIETKATASQHAGGHTHTIEYLLKFQGQTRKKNKKCTKEVDTIQDSTDSAAYSRAKASP